MISCLRELSTIDLLKSHRDRDMQFDKFLPPAREKHFFLTGRRAIYQLIVALGLSDNDTVLLPAYVPQGVIDPFIVKGVRVSFYPTDRRLLVDPVDIDRMLVEDQRVQALVIIHPMGFLQQIDAIKDICNKKGVCLIEDNAQGLFSRYADGKFVGSKGDVALFSLNKFLPVPDGAVLVVNNPTISLISTGTRHGADAIADRKYKAEVKPWIAQGYYLFHLYTNHLVHRSRNNFQVWTLLKVSGNFYEKYYQRIRYDFRPKPMSALAKRILSAIDLEQVALRRSVNCRYVYQNLDSRYFRLVFDRFPDNVVPLALPAFVPEGKRSQVIEVARRQGVYLSTLVEKWDHIPARDRERFKEENYYLENHVLIPINEFLTSQEMNYMVRVLNNL